MSKAIQFKNKNNEKIYPCPYFPIGYIYLSVTNVNPATIFGGTWERIKGRFLLGADDTNYVAGNVGGNSSHYHTTANHTLTINEMPKHAHNVVAVNKNDSGTIAENFNGASFILNYNKGITYSTPTRGWNNGVAMNSSGKGQAHNHGNTGNSSSMPPYLVIYMWKRVA